MTKSPITRILICLAILSTQAHAKPTELFDGKSTAGWANPFDWGEVSVENGELVLTGSPKYFLVTERTYRDFDLELEINVPVGGNSGIQFRSHYRRNRLWGYQAEVDTSERKWAGGFYDEGRRGWLVPLKDQPERQSAFKNGEWNKYRIRAVGDHIQIWVNGIQTVDAHDAVTAEGHIALQHHGEKGMAYRFRNIRINEITRPVTLTHIAFGSCAKQDQPQPIWFSVVKQQPELFIMLGDNIYGDTEDMSVLAAKYGQLNAQPGFMTLRKNTPIYGVWDDHDYGVNDGGKEYPMRDESQQVFNDFFRIPEGANTRRRPGTYDSFIFGPTGKRIQLILLDTRYFRDALVPIPDDQKDTLTGRYIPTDDQNTTVLGDEQWAWLDEQLQMQAELRIIASSIQFIPSEHGWEMWANFPHERKRMLDLLAEHDHCPSIFISGDRHLAEISKQTIRAKNGDYPVYDITASSFNRPGSEQNKTEPNKYRIAGENYIQENYGSIQIKWRGSTPKLTMLVHGIDGSVVRKHVESFR